MTEVPHTTSPGRSRLPAYALVVGTGISMVGNVVTAVALPWFVLQTTGSAAQTGLTGFAFFLPALVAGILGGVLVDRLGGKRMSVIADVVSGVGVAMVPLLYATVGLAFWQLLAFVFLGALLDIPGLTARRSLLPDLAARGGIRPEAMSSAFESTWALSYLVGPPLAGVLLSWMDAVWVLWIDAATFAVSALLVAVAIPGRARTTTGDAAPQGYLAAIGAGLRFLRRDRLLLALVTCITISNFIYEPLWVVVMPILVDERFGVVSALAWILTAYGVAALAGSLLYGVIGHRFRSHRRAIFLVTFASTGLYIWALLPDFGLPFLVVATFVSALITGPIDPLLVTVRLERIPAALRGRVFSTYSALAIGTVPLGMVAAGYLIEATSLRTYFVVAAALSTALVVAMLAVRSFHDMDIDERDAAVTSERVPEEPHSTGMPLRG